MTKFHHLTLSPTPFSYPLPQTTQNNIIIHSLTPRSIIGINQSHLLSLLLSAPKAVRISLILATSPSYFNSCSCVISTFQLCRVGYHIGYHSTNEFLRCVSHALVTSGCSALSTFTDLLPFLYQCPCF